MSEVIPFEQGMSLGMGFKKLDHAHGLINAVKIEANDAIVPSPDASFNHYFAETQSELASALDVSAALAIDNGSLSISGSGQLLKKTMVSEI